MSVAALAFRDWFGVSPSQARILAALYAHEDYLPLHRLAREAAVSCGAVRVEVVGLRRAMDGPAVVASRGRGYRLADPGRAECRAALVRLSAELAALAGVPQDYPKSVVVSA